MSHYSQYNPAGYQIPSGDPHQEQPGAPSRHPQSHLQQAPTPPGYQQGASPYPQNPPSFQQNQYGQTPQNGYPYQGTPGQEQGFLPPQSQAAAEGQGGMGGLTSQMGGMGLGGEGAAISRPNKKKNRHAYHNIDQPVVSSQAFNQSTGNAGQYVNQDLSQQVGAGNPYAGQQVTPAMNQFPARAAPFSPGLQSSGAGFANVATPMPATSGPGVSAQGRVDPEQIPSIPRARDGAAQYYLDHIYPTMEQHLPPPGSVPFVAQDQGNSSPKYARLTLNNIPSTSNFLSQTGLPLGIILQPLAPLQAGERPIPVLDFGELGPPRCSRCRAYINPFMTFRSGGNKLVCNMCTFPNDVIPEYFAPTDPSGVRVDRAQRPELTTGTVEYLVPKEYWAKEPVGLRWLYVIDVSQDAVSKGFLEAFCEGILSTLYGEDEDNVDDEGTNGENESNKRRIPVGSKVGFVTFDKAMHFYNCNENLERAQMLVMPDIEDPFVPLGSEGLFVDPYRSKSVITSLLTQLPALFSHVKNPEPALLPTLESALSSLSATGGKIVCSLASLPTWGPGRLFLRDKNDLHGIETEKKLFQTDHPGFRKLAGKMVESGVGIDFFIAAPAGKYMDVATIGHLSAVSGGQVYYYPNYVAPRDSLQLAQEIKHTLTRETGYQALMKVRCSNGLQVSSYHGNFLQHNFGADLEFGIIDSDKSIGVMFSYDGKLDAKLDAHFQCALLYTTASGERRVRCTNTVAGVSEGAIDSMRFVDQDAVVNVIAKEAATRMIERPLKDVRNALTEKTIDILAGYRKTGSGSHPPGQLVLPENLKEFSMYILGLMKSRAFKAGHEPSDRRTHTMRLLKSASPLELSLFLYPRILPLHSLAPESGFPDPSTGHLVLPPTIRASFARIEEGGAYLVDDGQVCLLWLHAHVSPNLLEDLFGEGKTTLSSLDPMMSALPVLETHLNAQVRNLLAYWASVRGSKGITIQLARQGLDGSEYEFARLLVEDRNNEAQSYVDWLVNLHRHIQMELSGQRKREDGGGMSTMGMENAVAGITSLWTELNAIFLLASHRHLHNSQAALGSSRAVLLRVDNPALRLQRAPSLSLQAGGAASIATSTNLRLGTVKPRLNEPVKQFSGSSLQVEASGPGGSMGSFVFKWHHPADEVYVTGTFDDWAKSVRLEKKGEHFEKLVELPLSNEKIFYKFVVDGNWTTDHTAPQENDGSSNVNNVLLAENITRSQSSGPEVTGIMSGVTPQSTTAGLAGNVPKEAERGIRPESASSDVPGSIPETPFHDASEYNVDPIPATSGLGNPVNLAPGEKVPHPNTLTSNTVSSTVHDDLSLKKSAEDSEQTFGVTPLPATTGIGNPISLQPGEKVPQPSEFTRNTTTSHVTTDKESYENAGGAPQLPDVVTPDKEREALGGMFKMPGIGGTMIPESSLPMGEGAASEVDKGPMIQSAGPQSSTAALAANVPLEPRGVPEIVQASQQEAGQSTEASENRTAVKEKSATEKELETKVPEEPATSEGPGAAAPEGSAGKDKDAAMAAGGVVAGGAVAATAAAKTSHDLPASVQQSIDEMNAGSAIAPTVPDVVQESITESHQSPEAAGDKTMVGEKSAVEKELLSEVKREDGVGEPAPSSSAALAVKAPAPTKSEDVPPSVSKDSAPLTTAAAPAQTPATGNSMKQAVQSQPDSRDISPMSKPIKQTQNQTQPTVTTGVGSSAAPQKSQQPDKATSAAKSSPAASSSTAADKKAKRASGFFGKLKSKFSDKK